MQDTYRISDIDIQKLDYGFISDYKHWLKTVRSCDHNTTMKYLANFKKIVLICVKKRWLTTDPFGEFKMTKRKKRRKALSQIDLNNLAAKKFSCERLAVVRDVFLFSCYTGLAYADVEKLKRTDVFIGIDGHKWITCQRKKMERNDSTSNIPLLPIVDRKYSLAGLEKSFGLKQEQELDQENIEMQASMQKISRQKQAVAANIAGTEQGFTGKDFAENITKGMEKAAEILLKTEQANEELPYELQPKYRRRKKQKIKR